ncbi:2OG-Fe(II) oxygenase [Sphingomonas sp. ASY06-1R]|uniref:2OG-Fe(II) oxygenase family protein n=1 Tax=Sphingomonas sp. ASY06-1R TaxID=3445771 RepID=UPI003FA21A26
MATPLVALKAGEEAPMFVGATLGGNAQFHFDTAAGCPTVLLFLGSGRSSPTADALALVARHRALFDDVRARFFGVTADPDDAATGRIARQLPGIRWFLDYDGAISRAYGAAEAAPTGMRLKPCWFLLDAMQRIVLHADLADGPMLFGALADLIASTTEPANAPVLIVPRLFEPELCSTLIRQYEQNGGSRSGFMREENGRTVAKFDDAFKRRHDYHIQDEAFREVLRERLVRRLLPQIEKAFQFRATRVERWMVACYDSESGGFFRPHRDNTTAGTAHRRFACTINLNADEYEGGELRFPEFGSRTYRAPTGGAVIFSCSLLHEAMPVTRGKRYAFLPFFYDDASARLRERNQARMAPELAGYRMDRMGDGDEARSAEVA